MESTENKSTTYKIPNFYLVEKTYNKLTEILNTTKIPENFDLSKFGVGNELSEEKNAIIYGKIYQFSYDKYASMWEEEIGSKEKNFIRHLIQSFIIRENISIESNDKNKKPFSCTITNFYLLKIDEINAITVNILKNLEIDDVEHVREFSEIYKLRWLSPIFSKNSDRVLSYIAYTALLDFCIETNDNEMNKLIQKTQYNYIFKKQEQQQQTHDRFKPNTLKKPTRENHSKPVLTNSNIDDSQLNKLKNLKEKMETNNN